MTLSLAKTKKRTQDAGFTLVEVLIAFVIFTITISGLLYGYIQANRMAEWASMSLAAQAYATQGVELARSAQWNSQQFPYASGPGTGDELPPDPTLGYTNYSLTDTMDVPQTGALITVTNSTTVSTIPASGNVMLRQIRCDVYWTFPLDGILCTNTAITLRGPDQ
jgi:prepilin-type N-terminal cleavage/methylation domain-containing protein